MKSETNKKTRFAGFAEKRAQLVTESEREPISSPVEIPTSRNARAPGKKSDPNFVQVTVYLHKDVHQTARKILFDDRRQFSDLVDELVTNWIKKTDKTSGSLQV